MILSVQTVSGVHSAEWPNHPFGIIMRAMSLLQGLYARLFAAVYDPFMRDAEQRILSRHRRELLEDLTGRVVEIGSGSGVNFRYYGNISHVHAVEPSDHLWRRALKKLHRMQTPPPVEVLRTGIEDEAALTHIQDGAIDAVVCTLVLCTVPDPEAVIRRAVRWLRPQGKLIILEHVQSRHPGEAWLYNLATPIWKRLAEGCHLNRPTDAWLRESGLDLESEEYFRLALPFYRGVFVKRSR